MKARVSSHQKRVQYTQPQNSSHKVRLLTSPPKPFAVSEPQVKKAWSHPPPVLEKVGGGPEKSVNRGRVTQHGFLPPNPGCLFQGPLAN